MEEKSEDRGKRHPLNMRTTREIREHLEDAARKSGRSLAQEAEHRLQATYFLDQISDEIPFSDIAPWLLLISGTILAVEKTTGKSWLKDSPTYFAVCDVLANSLKTLPPFASEKFGASDYSRFADVAVAALLKHQNEEKSQGEK